MIARGAESNPSCFSPTPLKDIEKTLLPSYIRLVCLYVPPTSPYLYILLTTSQSKYFDHNWGLTKFCVAQFKSQHITIKKQDATKLRQALAQSKGFSGMDDIVGSWTGKEEFDAIAEAIEQHPPRDHRMIIEPLDLDELVTTTPPATQNPEPPGSGAPFMPNTYRMAESAMLSGHDAVTPTPGGGVASM